MVPEVENCLFWPLTTPTSYPKWEMHLVQARPVTYGASGVWEHFSRTSEFLSNNINPNNINPLHFYPFHTQEFQIFKFTFYLFMQNLLLCTKTQIMDLFFSLHQLLIAQLFNIHEFFGKLYFGLTSYYLHDLARLPKS